MFNMDLKSNGIAWVGNIYQKLEAMCMEVDRIKIQEKARYIESQVQTGCDNVMKFCEDFMQELLVSDSNTYDDVDEPVSDTSLKANVELPNNANLLEVSDVCTTKSVLILKDVTHCNNVEMKGEICNNCSDACVTVPSADKSASVLDKDVTAEVDAHKLQMPMLSPEEYFFILSSSQIGAPFTERSNDYDLNKASMNSDVTKPNMEMPEDFEDVKHEETLFGVGKKNVLQARKKKLDKKKKVLDMFASRLQLARVQKTQSHDGDVQAKQCEEISMPARMEAGNTKMLVTHDVSDSEWELL